jgi:GMP synthase (glutamine-hydrolysing)
VELVVLEPHRTTGAHRFADVLDARHELARWRRVDLDAGDPLPPDPASLAGLVVMGGPQSVLAPEPWQSGVLELLRAAIDVDLPVLGVCLGAQLLGLAGGGEVARRDRPEIAYLPLQRTDAGADDELTAGWPEGAATLLWHEDEVTLLPPDAVPLQRVAPVAGIAGTHGEGASDRAVTWRLGSAVATQAHPEVDASQLAAWIEQDALDRQLAAAGTDAEALLAEARRRERFTLAVGLSLIGRFVDGPVRRRVTGSTR